MERSKSSRPAILLPALIIVLLPWALGLSLLELSSNSHPPAAAAATDTRDEPDPRPAYKDVQVDWTFYPDWEFDPLLAGPARYLVFMFHYTNNGRHPIWLMPSYTFVAPDEPRQAANEEVAMYIEDGIEDQVHAEDQTPIAFRIPPGEQRHYTVAFEKPTRLERFYVEVDAWQNRCLRLHYHVARDESGGLVWTHDRSEWVEKYLGRG